MTEILLFIFFILFFALCVKDKFLAICLLIFLIPLYLVRFSIFDIPTTVLEIMIYLLFITWFFLEGKSSFLYKRVKFRKEEKSFFIGIFLLFVGVFFSVFVSEDTRTSLGVFKGFFVDPLLFFLVFISVIKEADQVKKILQSVIFSSLAVAIVALLYSFYGYLTFDGRLSGFYESPNYLAMYLAPGFLLSIYVFLCGDKCSCFYLNNSKFLQYLVIFILGLSILLTKSFGSIFAVTVAISFVYLKNREGGFLKSRKKVLVFLLVIFSFLTFLTFQKFEQISNSSERSSFHSRLIIWRSSAEMIKESPFFGIGPGTFQKKYLDLQEKYPPYLEWAVSQPHNTFLAFYVQSGLFGLIGFLLILFWGLKKSQKHPWFALFIFYFLLHSFVDTLYWKNDLSLIFWTFFGLLVVLDKKYLVSKK